MITSQLSHISICTCTPSSGEDPVMEQHCPPQDRITPSLPSQQAVPRPKQGIWTLRLHFHHQEYSICAPRYSTAYISSWFCTSRTSNFYPISRGDGVYAVFVQEKRQYTVQHAVSGARRQAAPDVAQGSPVSLPKIFNKSEPEKWVCIGH